jgi:hypothetical protein
MRMQMPYAVRFLILSATFLIGCRTAHNVAVSSFRVIDAPANYVRRHLESEGPATATTTTTTTYQSDVVTPGRPIVGPTPTQRRIISQRQSPLESETSSNAVAREDAEAKPKSSPPSSQRTANSSGQGAAKIPYAKPVPGKPGYVYSPFDPNGGYVDVTGYAPGSKAKDPYSGKIFIVP